MRDLHVGEGMAEVARQGHVSWAQVREDSKELTAGRIRRAQKLIGE